MESNCLMDTEFPFGMIKKYIVVTLVNIMNVPDLPLNYMLQEVKMVNLMFIFFHH